MNSLISLLLALGLTLSGCQSVYYEAMEKMGSHKRNIPVDSVEEGKEAQEEARAQLFSAFDEFLAVSKVDMVDLKAAYDRIQDSLDRSESRLGLLGTVSIRSKAYPKFCFVIGRRNWMPIQTRT